MKYFFHVVLLFTSSQLWAQGDGTGTGGNRSSNSNIVTGTLTDYYICKLDLNNIQVTNRDSQFLNNHDEIMRVEEKSVRDEPKKLFCLKYYY